MGQSFIDKIEQLEKINTGEVKDTITFDEQQGAAPFDCGLSTDEYEDKLVAILNKIGTYFQNRIEKLEKGNR